MDDGENAQLDMKIHALVEKLELANDHEASKLVKQLQGRLDYTNYWYSNRLERLALGS